MSYRRDAEARRRREYRKAKAAALARVADPEAESRRDWLYVGAGACQVGQVTGAILGWWPVTLGCALAAFALLASLWRTT